MDQCCFIIQNSDQLEKCNHKAKYGDFCCKHKRNYLVEHGMINISKFTFKMSDYYVKDLAKYYHSRINHTKQKFKKAYYFNVVRKSGGLIVISFPTV